MPPEFDPATLDLAILLTAAGATVGATIIASLIEAAKRFNITIGPLRIRFGEWLDAGNENAASLVLSFGLVLYAYLVTTPDVTPANAFAAFVAFLGVAAISGRAYDAAHATKAVLRGG